MQWLYNTYVIKYITLQSLFKISYEIGTLYAIKCDSLIWLEPLHGKLINDAFGRLLSEIRFYCKIFYIIFIVFLMRDNQVK